MLRFILVPAFLCILSCTRQPLNGILQDAGDAVTRVMSSPDQYEVQILYVQIDRDKSNKPHFREYHYNADPTRYFYPASTVKFPVAVLALEKLHELHITGLDRNARMRIDSARIPQTPMLVDSSAENGLPSVSHFIHQIFLVSDNDAFNRLYEFLGQEEIHTRLRRHGLQNTRILHRLNAPEFTVQDNRYTNPVSFFHADTLIYQQPERVASEYIDPVQIKDQYKGKAYIDKTGILVPEPFDFSYRNFYPLAEQVQILKAIMFPESLPERAQFCIDPDDYAFLHKEMSMLPRESSFPVYDTSHYSDGYVKFFMFGDVDTRVPPHIRIFNKVGWAYGYMTDCAYIVDFKNNIEFILAATLLVNADQIFNDEKYEFEEVGIPFLAELGRAVYQYELQRSRKHTPDLSSLKSRFPEYPAN